MRRPPRWGATGIRVTIAVVSVVMIGVATVLATRIVYFLHRSSTQGAALVHTERRAIAAATGNTAACQSASGAGRAAAPDGLLEAPSLALVAPVLQGASDAVLSDAVGHVTTSVWPGQPGTSVLSAHDVTWFSGITGLRPGDVVRYVTPCRTYSFRVTSHAIVQAGAPVFTTRGARLVLDTCYPLDALYVTSTRYLVYATLMESSPTHPFSPPPRESWPVPTVPAPHALAAQGLSDASNYAPLGTLAVAGTQPTAWRQSSAPLAFETAALAEYFGLTRSAAENRHTWWADLAPSVPAQAAGALWNGVIETYDTRLSVSLSVRGGQPLGATLSADVTVAGAGYQVTVTETVRGGKLLATRVRVRQLG
jgi:LPXTG-site transpeptidase (sortase) family protein